MEPLHDHQRAPPEYVDAPPDYGVATGPTPAVPLPAVARPSPSLQAVDFLPRMTRENGPSHHAEYEPFGVLVERANRYLRDHPRCRVNTCESVAFRVYQRGQDIDTMQSVFTAYGEATNRYIRGLRLWTQQRPVMRDNPTEPQQLGYLNFLPDILHDGTIQRLDGVLQRINRTPIKGTIITMETLPIKWGSKALDPDRTIWTERGFASQRFLYLIRIFYIRGPGGDVQVGFQDFVPQMLEKEGFFSNPRMEPFPVVLRCVQQWLGTVPPNYRLVNVQTVMFRWSYNKGIDTQDMAYHEHKQRLNYLRFLRVAYAIQRADRGPVSRSTIQPASRLFIPEMTKPPGFFAKGVFETQAACRRRADQWVRAAEARIVCAETLVMRIAHGGESVYGFDAMHTWNDTYITSTPSTERDDERFGCLYRIYTDGMDRPELVGPQQDSHLENYTLQTDSGEGCTIA
ncbi:uncharacterized protein LOC129598617 isoform X2 [Paramacrobiotus metropolitanus]|uniref:uncharacterized protein LOC129598617 isoform X2 n=1 Tax=Paramacrobiotus metropolitanus TaxID=2943436 RepID=UPI00244629E3|nr:uncharacterized protein LOC129598617 isoform X2 [Paramacrobiotus metropolitanus]